MVADLHVGLAVRGVVDARIPLTMVREMSDDVAHVRSFNRVVTERVGALHQQYLARGRSLGASRALWEVDRDGTDVRTLRTRLGFDSGYMSRLLRGLEREQLVTVQASSRDKRVRTVQLTEAGRAERALLDRRSDELAGSLLAPLSESQRNRLLEAMNTVERLLRIGLVEVAVENPASAEAQQCLRSYFAELDVRFDTGFDPALSISADAVELAEPKGLLLVARIRSEPVGCGAIKFTDVDSAEVKRMWVAPSARGLGVGRRILDELERTANLHNITTLRLETNRALREAIGLYRSAGYEEVSAFNDEPYADHWFEKRLVP
jgi:DNA-binding MarR family transcriptional regulator/predicted GNAT family N-acyltransferase